MQRDLCLLSIQFPLTNWTGINTQKVQITLQVYIVTLMSLYLQPLTSLLHHSMDCINTGCVQAYYTLITSQLQLQCTSRQAANISVIAGIV